VNRFTILCCVLAGLAGWWGMALCEGGANPSPNSADARVAVAGPVNNHFTVKDTLQKLRHARSGSAEISRIAALLAGIPNDSLNDLQNELYSLPPSTTRQFALALLAQRLALSQPTSADRSAAPQADAEPPVNDYRELEEGMAEGLIFSDNSRPSGAGLNSVALCDWVSADPAVATAAILKMPPGASRESAVNFAADSLSLTDPRAALEFVLQSGEQHSGWGLAKAWTKLITGNAPAGGSAPQPEAYLHRMTRAQQDSLFSSLEGAVFDLDDSNVSPNNPSRGSDVTAVACAVLQARESGPGMESFFQNLVDEHPHAAEELRRFIESSSLSGPAARTAMEILCATRAEELVKTGMQYGIAPFFASDSWKDNPSPASPGADSLLNRSAPAIADTLAGTGRLPEALQLLDSLTDPDVRRDVILNVLPAWMDADPAAARAAFDATSMTALERERRERHPAFMLHRTREDQ
jgi:hypothetical protein